MKTEMHDWLDKLERDHCPVPWLPCHQKHWAVSETVLEAITARIAELEAVVEALPLKYTTDGIPYMLPFADQRTFWCAYRAAGGGEAEPPLPWIVTTCHLADDSDMASCEFDWHIWDCEVDEAELLGVWGTEHAARDAAGKDGA